jgi:hypothetical protein
LGDADLLVVGGPTHFHGMSRPRTRKWAAATARKPSNDLVLDRDADGPGVRDWLASLGHGHTKVAAFDTRVNGPAVLKGRASRQSAESFGSTVRGDRQAGELLRQFDESRRTGRGGPSPGMGQTARGKRCIERHHRCGPSGNTTRVQGDVMA